MSNETVVRRETGTEWNYPATAYGPGRYSSAPAQNAMTARATPLMNDNRCRVSSSTRWIPHGPEMNPPRIYPVSCGNPALSHRQLRTEPVRKPHSHRRPSCSPMKCDVTVANANRVRLTTISARPSIRRPRDPSADHRGAPPAPHSHCNHPNVNQVAGPTVRICRICHLRTPAAAQPSKAERVLPRSGSQGPPALFGHSACA